MVQGMITRYRNKTAFIVHFDDHLPISSQVDQDNNRNACQPARAITQSVTNSSKVGRKCLQGAYCEEEGEEGNERDPVVSMLPG